ncbi:MAG: hypothetical protein II834_04245 [Bacteroidaceae bacterium]|uniref:hypothetical protein n=1 Tax=unclassified Bacteroides TaxID=2646097 RepID=UPI0004E19200|nr:MULTISPECIES: hypothetical protein [unclassified Bacteroides]MBQ3771122.1 hypothetical protein [Bacteroidaceae bacterium]
MKKYNRIMLGQGCKYAKLCHEEGYIGASFEINVDLSDSLFENWRDFNNKFIPIWMEHVPGKSKTSAGLACGFLWTIIKGLNIGDVVLCPSGEGFYYIGTITSDYYYIPNSELPHRRKVEWINKTISRKDMSQNLKNSSGSIGTCCDITKYSEEIEALIAGNHYSAPVQHEHQKDFDERSLHKIFCSFLRTRNNYAKTIFHEKSSSKSDANQKWVHPDIVSVQFDNFKNDATLSLLKATEPKETIHIYSYELKKRIETDYQLKQYYFQALSNSSWANFGYLVAFEINEDLHEEIERLNNAFGIGVILMQVNDSKILFPAREKALDYTTIEKLNNLNSDFCEFITKLSKVLNATKDYTNDALNSFEKICDEIFVSDEEQEAYCKEHNIPF